MDDTSPDIPRVSLTGFSQRLVARSVIPEGQGPGILEPVTVTRLGGGGKGRVPFAPWVPKLGLGLPPTPRLEEAQG